ncbi:MAG: sugar ABC transporter substrate-binding protein [Clostridia bacterium]|nr:sugar ABC transporter substrate-binding protein [Clostridia bacterium]
MKYSDQTTQAFTDALSSSAPVPGGGGACALVGAVGAALASMVGNLTSGKKKYAEYEQDIQRILIEAEKLRGRLLAYIDEDAKCFEPLSRAYGISKDDPTRDAIMEKALRKACTAPMHIMRAAAESIELHAELEKKGSSLMQSDVAVGVLCCKAALCGASMNIYINVRSMKDEKYAAKLRRQTDNLLEKFCLLADETYEKVLIKLK